MILAIDTSTSAITVAVGTIDDTGAATIRDARSVIDARAHTERLAPLIADALSAAGIGPRDLTAIVAGTGPGPFTGLRVGLVTAATMGHALGVPVHGVCSLDALARTVLALGDAAPAEFVVATDARRKEVYWARYAVSPPASAPASTAAQPSPALFPNATVVPGVRAVSEPAVERPADLPEEVRALPTVGRGPLLFPELFPTPLDLPVDVDAGELLAVAGPRIVAGEDLPVTPLYLRRPDALTTAERAAR
jgi:tRNA threonylcarbamoyl adenosine modification protein YeaZ